MNAANNCNACNYSKMNTKGHCYMLYEEPLDVCGQHVSKASNIIRYSNAIWYDMYELTLRSKIAKET